jgi:glycosyltransferase involved in cell wall biosynthesis
MTTAPSPPAAAPDPATTLPQAPARIPGSFSLVLPAYNEEGNIEYVVRRALETLPTVVDDFEIIVVNDGSRDATPQIIDRLAAEDPRVKPVHQANQGYGGAVKAGFRASTGDYVMFMDADRQFDIADIRRLTPFVPAYDVVAGFRMERSDPLNRRINAEIFNVVVRILFGVHLRDLDCAFKIFRGDMLRSLDLTTSGALINAEMQAKLRRSGATIEQVGVGHYPRIAGEATGGSAKVILHAMGETVRLWRRMHRYQPPVSTRREERPYFVLGDVLLAAGLLTAGVVAVKLLRWKRRG